MSAICWVNSIDAATNEAYAQAGFNIVRHSVYRMRIDLTDAPPAPVWPDGITLRPFVAERDLRAVTETDRDAFRDHWGFVERSLDDEVRMMEHWLQSPYTDPALWLVAVDGDRIAGISLNQRRPMMIPTWAGLVRWACCASIGIGGWRPRCCISRLGSFTGAGSGPSGWVSMRRT